MSSDIDKLKNEVNQLDNLDENERKEILADLRLLEEFNKKTEQNEFELRNANQMKITSFILGVLVILYLAYKVWWGH